MQRTLYLKVSNTGDAAVLAPPIVLTIDPILGSPRSLESPTLGTLAARSTRTYAIPVRIGAVSAGRYRVRGTLGFVGEDVSFAATTDVVPWGLLAVLAVMVQFTLLAARNRLRRRLLRGGRHRSGRTSRARIITNRVTRTSHRRRAVETSPVQAPTR
jgi:hypothetical protein